MQPLGTRLGYYRLQKWAAIALARYLAPARGLDPWRRPKRIVGSGDENGLKCVRLCVACAILRSSGGNMPSAAQAGLVGCPRMLKYESSYLKG